MFPFPDFESSIDEVILKRGQTYHTRGHVDHQIDVLGNGEFSTIVYGSEDYEVYIKIENQSIQDCTCTCPYYEDWDNVCKHIVAVLLHIKAEKLYKVSKKSVLDKLEKKLDKLSKDDLIDYLLDYAKTNRKFRDDLKDYLD